jgi:hypothetical protein
MERGLVVTPAFTFDGNTLNFPGLVGIESTDLKHYLLYWDKIEYPNNNIIHIGTSADEQFLIDAGVLTRPTIMLQGFSGNIGYAYILAQDLAFQKRNQEEPGCWAIAQSSTHLVLPQATSSQESTIEIALYGALPSPGSDVSLEDILVFKQKRPGELRAFRHLMDELYLDVINSADILRSKTAAIDRLENAIRDLHAVADESWASKLLSGFKVELNVPNLAGHALAGVGIASSFGFPLALGAAMGAISAAIKFEFASRPKTKGLPDNLKDYAYLYHVQREFSG